MTPATELDRPLLPFPLSDRCLQVSGEQEMAREQEQHMRQNRDRSTHPTAMGENADPNAYVKTHPFCIHV